MFEHRSDPLLPRKQFIGRMRRCALLSAGLIGVTLAIGMCGYRFFENMGWPDAFANASMIVAGMGPLGNLQTTGGKIFAGIYALFCGLVFITATGLLVAPLWHRALHKFNLETGKQKNP